MDLEVIVHTILGLPGETKEDILETVSYLNTQDIQGIKLQLLHILKGTDLAKDYEEGRFSVYTMEEYIDLVIACLEHLSPRIVIHRLDVYKRQAAARAQTIRRILFFFNCNHLILCFPICKYL